MRRPSLAIGSSSGYSRSIFYTTRRARFLVKWPRAANWLIGRPFRTIDHENPGICLWKIASGGLSISSTDRKSEIISSVNRNIRTYIGNKNDRVNHRRHVGRSYIDSKNCEWRDRESGLSTGDPRDLHPAVSNFFTRLRDPPVSGSEIESRLINRGCLDRAHANARRRSIVGSIADPASSIVLLWLTDEEIISQTGGLQGCGRQLAQDGHAWPPAGNAILQNQSSGLRPELISYFLFSRTACFDAHARRLNSYIVSDQSK